MAYITDRLESIVYDGTNASFIVSDWLAGATLLETAPNGTLKVQYNGSGDWEYVPVGNYVLRRAENSWGNTFTPTQYVQQYVEFIPSS